MRARILVACCALAWGCASQMADDTVTEEQPIIGGHADPDDKSVVAIVSVDGAGKASLCTGAVIGPRSVLTAAHCVKDQVGFDVIAGDNIASPKATHFPVSATTFDDQYDPNDDLAGHDIACVKLDRDFPAPALSYNRLPGLGTGDARIVGFGTSSHLGPVDKSCGPTCGIKRVATTSRVRAVNEGLVEIGSRVAEQCHGDSGGPAFRKVDGVERIIGITSFSRDVGRQVCVGPVFDTRVDAYLHFIDDCAASPRIVVFGGVNDQGELADTWEWDGANWAPRAPSANPSARSYIQLANQKDGHSLVLFGGNTGNGSLGDTWAWNEATWSQPQPAAAPSPRFEAAMTFDSARGVTVLFGGTDGSTIFGDTWEWDGTTWAQRIPATSPSPRYLTALAFDSVRKKVVAFGGLDGRTDPWAILNDTWEWDGTTWTERAPAASPPPRYAAGVAFDSARGKMVVFGGTTLNLDGLGSPTALDDTWEWDGTNWTRNVTSGPSGRAYARMAYDPAHHATVLFGGQTGADLGYQKMNETWTWDGAAWIQQSPAIAPPPRIAHGMTFTFE